MSRPRYIAVFPSNPVFDEYRLAYQRASSRLGWLTVEDFASWTPDRPEWDDPDAVVLFWWSLPEVIPPRRQAECLFWYVESIPVADSKALVSNQREWLDRHLLRAMEPDLFIVGTSAARDFLAPRCRAVVVAPTGYDPEVMGVPDWNVPKTYDIGFCGASLGRRQWILPALTKRFGPRFRRIHLVYGRDRNALFNSCRAMLYIGHSEDIGVGLRLWQAVSTSAALVTEERDAWPAVPGLHYVGIPHAREEHPDAFADSVEAALKLPLSDIASAAHEDLSKYTVERCLEEFVVPAVQALGEAP